MPGLLPAYGSGDKGCGHVVDPGLELAAEFLADNLRRAGLEPAPGSETHDHEYTLAGVELGKTLSATLREYDTVAADIEGALQWRAAA